MNFKKGDKNRLTISHYTPVENAKSIMTNGFEGGSVYIGNDDTLKDELYDIKNLNGRTVNKRVLNGAQKLVNTFNDLNERYKGDEDYIKYRIGDKLNDYKYVTDPNNRHLITYANADKVLENGINTFDSDGKWKINDVGTPIRYVADVDINKSPRLLYDDIEQTDKPVNKDTLRDNGYQAAYKSTDGSLNILPINPYNTDSRNDHRGAWDLRESRVKLNDYNDRSGFKNPRIQIPFGAMTQENSQKYLDNLKDLNRSDFDANDTYTRRLYNLYAKKNGLKQIADPRSFKSGIKTRLSNIFKKSK